MPGTSLVDLARAKSTAASIAQCAARIPPQLHDCGQYALCAEGVVISGPHKKLVGGGLVYLRGGYATRQQAKADGANLATVYPELRIRIARGKDHRDGSTVFG